MRVLPQWSLAPVVDVDALVALRGFDKLAAMVTLADRGNISRFDLPLQLTALLGLVPSEHCTGRRRGGITGTDNAPAADPPKTRRSSRRLLRWPVQPTSTHEPRPCTPLFTTFVWSRHEADLRSEAWVVKTYWQTGSPGRSHAG